MSASQSQRDIWPEQTPAPSSKRRRALDRRQTITDQSQVSQAQQDCEDSGNNIFSCFPTADTVVPQDEWASFVWNSRRPDLTQTNKVDIFLFRADSWQQILSFTNVTNPTFHAGTVGAQVNDVWFGRDGLNWSGSNVSFPYFWVIIRSDKTLDGSQIPQATFTAVQTRALDSVLSSSSAAAAASSSSAHAASVSLASLTSTTSTPSGNVQSASSSSSFPHWAIAVIVVLGFLAITATCILVFLILRRIRRQGDKNSNRSSMGSASPMIARGDQDMIQRYSGSPPLPPHTGIPTIATGISPSTTTRNLATDAASTISDSGGPFSVADAAIIADAFRKKLRKPDFAGPSVDEGDSPDTAAEREAEDAGDVVLSRELAEEGRDIRSVSSSRGVKVESQVQLEPGEGS